MVWIRQSGARLRVVICFHVPALRARGQKRLGLLRLVLWARLRGGNDPAVPGQALYGALCEPALQGPPDALHALLPMVPHESQEALETHGQSTPLQGLQIRYRQ